MPTLQEVHARLTAKKRERRELKQSFQDELRNNARHEEIIEELKKLRAEKKSLENELASRELDREKLDEIASDIATDVVLLADIALNMYVKSEPVEIVDELNIRWVPQFSVRFKRDA